MYIHYCTKPKSSPIQLITLTEEGIQNILLSYFYSEEFKMLIYFVDPSCGGSSLNRYEVTGKAGANNLLISNAKRPTNKRLGYWKNGVDIYFAGHGGGRMVYDQIDKHLESFYYKEQILEKAKTSDINCRLIVDSGAFSAYKSGKIIHIKEYAEWALKFKDEWEHKLKSLYFVNLDIIGDQEGSDRNLKILQRMGFDPLPVLTVDAKRKQVEWVVNEYPFFLLAGGAVLGGQQLKIWFDFVFSIVKEQYEKTGVMPKIHLLGATKEWVLKRYPAFSSDSSSWLQPVMFGNSKHSNISSKLPSYAKGDLEMETVKHALKKEIRFYQKMEQDMTKLWTLRGIEFNE